MEQLRHEQQAQEMTGEVSGASSGEDLGHPCLSGVLCCLALSVVYVGSFYIWRTPLNRYNARSAYSTYAHYMHVALRTFRIAYNKPLHARYSLIFKLFYILSMYGLSTCFIYLMYTTHTLCEFGLCLI